ncbi:hypothetical protein J6590_021743 [Homalodisca vitripennis]|nr:hypothetical protein J6590_021743 [Homalodisca vitripennis]
MSPYTDRQAELFEILLLRKHAVRIISSAGFLDHCKPLFNRLKILTVFSQYVVASLLHVKENLAAFRTRGEAQDAYRLRNSSQLNTVSCRLSKTRYCFPALASRDFECRLRKWSLANPLYSIKDFFEIASNIA